MNNINNESIELNPNFTKIAIVGNVDSGKSTLVGVLTKGFPDDGRGAARKRVFNYAHEELTGRTSSIAHEIMCYDDSGKQIFPDRFIQNKNKYWGEITPKAKTVINLIDLCGHEKYLKTTMFGMVGMVPDYVMIIVGANMGLSRMTKEHLGITIALNIPFFVVITKIDMTPPEIVKNTIEDIQKILKSNSVARKGLLINNDEEIDIAVQAIASEKICPLFKISSVTKEGVDNLVTFMRKLKNRNSEIKVLGTSKDNLEFDIHDRFKVNGVGIVISGVVKSGILSVGSNIIVGPDKNNKFKGFSVKSIHVNRNFVDSSGPGQFCSINIKSLNKKDEITKKDFRKGMVVLDANFTPKCYKKFKAEIVVLHHSTTITKGYEAVMHSGVIRQTVKIEHMEKELLRTGDKSLVTFTFCYYAEYLKKGMTILLRDGRTKILGIITELIE